MSTQNTMSNRTYAYQIEPIDNVLDNVELTKQHFDECMLHLGLEFSPDREAYNEQQELGNLLCYVVRLDGEMVGYATVIGQPSHFCKGHTVAFCDSIYVLKEHRPYCGKKLIEFVSDHLLSINIQHFYHSVPQDSERDWGLVLERMGYKAAQMLWYKGLADGRDSKGL